MKKYLFLCNTYSQFINATHMKLTIFRDSQVDIVLTDQTNGLSDVSKRLSKIEGLFENIYFIQTKQYCAHKNLFGYIQDVKHVLIGDQSLFPVSKCKYDEVITYNIDYSVFVIFDILKKENNAIVLSRMEESVLSYNHRFDYPRINIVNKLRKLFGKDSNFEDASLFYCYYPELYKGKAKTVRIPQIDNDIEEISQILSKCFNLKNYSYKEKYIFFSSVYDFEGGYPIGEYNAVVRIASIVGKDNLLIKQHPRDTRTVYKDNGFRVDTNSSIPWEVIQFQVNVNEKKLLTVNSSSILSSALLFSRGATSFFVYKMCDLSKNKMAQESISAIEELLDSSFAKENLNMISVISSEKELG